MGARADGKREPKLVGNRRKITQNAIAKRWILNYSRAQEVFFSTTGVGGSGCRKILTYGVPKSDPRGSQGAPWAY